MRPDLIVVTGDLTAAGYREEFVAAKEFLELLHCPNLVVLAGNHDCRNVGYVHFEELFGPRYATHAFDIGGSSMTPPRGRIKIVASDSNKPDLNDGEVGRGQYHWIKENFADTNDFKIFALHHHLVSVPGTGRERNIIWDAGDVLNTLRASAVDLILCGHKHVPNVWEIGGMFIVNSGTVSTYRTRGRTGPSYNMIDVAPKKITISVITPGKSDFIATVYPRAKAFPELSEALARKAVTRSGRGRE